MTIKTKAFQGTQEEGEKLAKEIKNGGVVALYGDLGAGKTTFVQGVAKGLGITDRVVSPTFIIVRRYEIPNGTKVVGSETKVKETGKEKRGVRFFWHIDLYRLGDIREIRDLGIEEIMKEPGNIVLIEWPEKMGSLLPEHRFEIRFKQTGEDTREIDIRQK